MQTVIEYNKDPMNDYRLILDTPAAMKRKIATVKTDFDRDYRGNVIAGGNPFVYLASFSQLESRESGMADALDKIAMGLMPFRLRLKDFGCMDDQEIFIDVADKELVLYIVQQLGKATDYMQQARFNENPRITIGQRLQPWQFEKSWMKHKSAHFSAVFLADQMLLLKRMEGFRSWQVLRHMAFQNQLVV